MSVSLLVSYVTIVLKYPVSSNLTLIWRVLCIVDTQHVECWLSRISLFEINEQLLLTVVGQSYIHSDSFSIDISDAQA